MTLVKMSPASERTLMLIVHLHKTTFGCFEGFSATTAVRNYCILRFCQVRHKKSQIYLV